MYENFFNHSNEILFITDDKGNLLDINHSFFNMLGYTKKQILLTNIKDLMHQDEVDKTLIKVLELSPKETINFEHNFIHLDGNSLTLNCSAYMDVETTNIFITAKYVTQNNAKAEMTKLVKHTAHEINNPLGIISGYTELIKSQPDLNMSTNEKLDVILNNCERIVNIIQNLKQTYCSDSELEK